MLVDFDIRKQKFTIQEDEVMPEDLMNLIRIQGLERDMGEGLWLIPCLKGSMWRLGELFKDRVVFTQKAREKLYQLDKAGDYTLGYDEAAKRFLLFAGRNMKSSLDSIGDCRYRKAAGCWSIPDNHWSLIQLYRIFSKEDLAPTTEAQSRLDFFTQKLKVVTPLIEKIKTIKPVDQSLIDTDGFQFRGTYTPREHQLKMWWAAYNMLLQENVGFFLFCGVGTGKSLVAANVAAALHEKGLVDKVLVITPASLKFNFAEQVQIHSPYSSNVLVSYAPDRRKGKDGRRWLWTESKCPITDYYMDYNEYLEEPDSLFHIINFEAAATAPHMFVDKYDMLIIDEVHYVKSRSSARTRASKKIARTVPRRLGMTGTPVVKDPLDIWSLYNVVDPDIFPNRYIDFRDRVAIKKIIKGKDREFPLIVGWKPEGIEWVNDNIYKRAIRYRTEECMELPEKVYQRIVIEPPADVKRFYKELKDDLVAEIGQMGQEGYQFVESPNRLAVISKLRQVASGFVGLEDEENPGRTRYYGLNDFKFKAVIDLLENLEGCQVILWYWHDYVRDKLVSLIKEKFEEPPMIIDGATSATEKAKRIHQFQQGAYNFAVWNIQVSEGNTATAANVSIYVENSFTYKDRHQSEGRIYREGQKRVTTFIDVATKGTVDLRILKAIEQGESLSEAVLLETIHEW